MLACVRVGLTAWMSCGVLACGSAGRDPNTWFPEDYWAGYVEVAGCANSGVHGGPWSRTWMSPEAATHFSDQRHRGDAPTPFPQASVIVKAQYRDSGCRQEHVLWTVMRKGAPELAPESADWEWQTVYANGEIAQSGQVGECINCHSGCETSDYVCTVP